MKQVVDTTKELFRIKNQADFDAVMKNFEYDGIEKDLLSDTVFGYDTLMREIDGQTSEIYALFYEGRPVAVGGVYPYNRSTGYVWLMLNQDASKIVKQVVTYIHGLIYKFMMINGYHRLMSFCMKNAKAERFMQHFGFKREAVMKNFYDYNIDACLYAIVKEGVYVG